jgi:hypothetical protein
MSHSVLRSTVATALAAALVAGTLRASAQVVIQSDEEPPSAPTASAPPTPAPAPPPAPPPPPAGSSNVNVTSKGVHAETERDCAANPQDERCTEKSKVDVGAGGLEASYSKETVERVKEPPSTAVNVALDVGGGTIVGLPNMSMVLANADIKLKILAGGQFPGADGGSWNGVILEPSASLMAVFMSMSMPQTIAGATFQGPAQSSTVWGFQAGGAVGWQFMYFGSLNEDTLKQHGFGLEIGGYVGATGISVPQASLQVNASYGPVVGFTFPSYNAGTASYSSFSITLFVLPTADGSVLMSGGLGWIF